MYQEDKRIQKATRELFAAGHFNDPCAVTLTMKQRYQGVLLDPILCTDNFRHFSNRLNKAILGNSFTRYGNRIPIRAVRERSHSQRYHYHAVIDRPDRVNRDEFRTIVSDCWNSTLWGYRKIDFQFDMSAGWIDYITKLAQKEVYSDSIDWQNFHA